MPLTSYYRLQMAADTLRGPALVWQDLMANPRGWACVALQKLVFDVL